MNDPLDQRVENLEAMFVIKPKTIGLKFWLGRYYYFGVWIDRSGLRSTRENMLELFRKAVKELEEELK